MKRHISMFAVMLFLLSVAVGDEAKNPLAGTPFEGYDVGGAKQVGFSTPLHSANLGRLMDVGQLTGLNYINLIEKYALHDELKLSDKQTDRLRKLSIPIVNTVFEAIGTTEQKTAAVMDAKEFAVFLRTKWIPAKKRVWAASNAEVEEILDKRQMKRLKQLLFQVHCFVFPKPVTAFSSHGRRLSDQEARLVNESFSTHRKQVGIARKILHFRERGDILARAIGRKSLTEFTGPLHNFGESVDRFPALAELLSEQKVQEESNPRRKK